MDFATETTEHPRHRDAAAEERVIPVGDTAIRATLNVPLEARGLVALLHASSAGRFANQSIFASEALGQANFATLQVDLLTPDEEAALVASRQPEQHLSLLSSRVQTVVDWLAHQRETEDLAVGLFAARLETIPALLAAERAPRIAAVVSQGGLPDFAPNAVRDLAAPTLMIVGREEQARAVELASEFFARHLVERHDSCCG